MNILTAIYQRLKLYPSLLYWVIVYVYIDRNYLPRILFELPFGIHDWAQADRCSIALAYFHNTINPFDMATLNLTSEGGKVGTELPLFAYLASLIGRITDVTMVYASFRCINLSIVFLGCFFLYKLIYKYTKSIPFSLLGSFFPLISVNTMFYSASYLSDAPALGLVLIAFYFFSLYIDGFSFKNLTLFVVFGTLAHLTKMSTISYTASMSFLVFLGIYKQKKYKEIALLSIPFILFCLQYLYIRHRLNLYHSPIFLTGIIGFKEWKEFINITILFKNELLEHYFPLSQIALWVGLVLSFIFSNLNSDKDNTWFKSMKILFGLTLFFINIMYYCFGYQFNVHDYYFISIFLPFFSISFTIAMIFFYKHIKDSNSIKTYVTLALVFHSIVGYSFVEHKFLKVKQKFESNEFLDNYRFRHDLYYGNDIMNKLHIGLEDKILAVNDHTPNLTFSHFNRKGYIVRLDKSQLSENYLSQKAREKKVSYAILQKRDFDSFTPPKLKQWEVCYQREKMIILKLIKP